MESTIKTKIKVLVADDDINVHRQVFQAIIERDEIERFEILTATTPQEAINTVLLDDPHVCVLDLNYKDHEHNSYPNEGLILVERIAKISDAGIIILSAFPDDNFMPESKERGADFYIEKLHASLTRKNMFIYCLNECSNYYLLSKNKNSKIESIVFQIGELLIDVLAGYVRRGEGPRVKLTHLECKFLSNICTSRNAEVDLVQIYQEIYSDQFVDGSGRIKNLIKRLNKKIQPWAKIKVNAGLCILESDANLIRKVA